MIPLTSKVAILLLILLPGTLGNLQGTLPDQRAGEGMTGIPPARLGLLQFSVVVAFFPSISSGRGF